jgi:hypothetical protein
MKAILFLDRDIFAKSSRSMPALLSRCPTRGSKGAAGRPMGLRLIFSS